MSSLPASVPAKLSPVPVSTAFANAAVQRVFAVVDSQPEVQELYRQAPLLKLHLEAIMMSIHFNDDGFEEIIKCTPDELADELRRRPPARLIGKTAPPLPSAAQARSCPSLRPG